MKPTLLVVAILLAIVACSENNSGPAGAVATVQVTSASPVIYHHESYLLTATPKDARGRTVEGRTVEWQSSNPAVIAVNNIGTITALSVGSATLSATVDGVTGSLALVVQPVPEVTSVLPAALQPGTIATITGSGFPEDSTTLQVTVGGRNAQVTSASPTAISIIVPCVQSGPNPVRVSRSGAQSAAFTVAVNAPQRVLALGESIILPSATAAACNEFVGSSTALFVAVIFNTSTNVGSQVPVQLLGNAPLGANSGEPAPSDVRAAGTGSPHAAEPVGISDHSNAEPVFLRAAHATFGLRDNPGEHLREREHVRHLERSRGALAGSVYPAAAAASRQGHAGATQPPALGELRNYFYTYSARCQVVNEIMRTKAVVIGQRIVIWEDEANALQSSQSPMLLDYMRKLVRIYDEEQYGLVRQYFGDPLLRDAAGTNEGVVHVVVSKRVNDANISGYTSTCDQQPRSVSPGSNLVPAVYLAAPSSTGGGVTSIAFADGWYAQMSVVLVHESKHLASYASRAAKGAVAELSWLEEGTARLAEEIWARDYLHQSGWRQNAGWGTTTSGVYCDFHLTSAACIQADPQRRPSLGSRRGFNNVLPKLQQPWDYSPFGDAPSQAEFTYTNTAWSYLRYVTDRFALDEATFLRSLVGATSTGMTNLTQASGATIEETIGGWGLALYADDYPGLSGTNTTTRFASWNLRSIYAGLNEAPSWTARFPTAYPVQPFVLPEGVFTTSVAQVRGGAHLYLQFAGRGDRVQLLNVQAPGTAALSANVRMAVVRVR